ncbi:MAG: 2-oxoacid:acceptor oxidoreductase subunit alpha [Deltaproteobacteria bacterium]|nr:2-oxoacid:acceptor oxidoreductase subunit alpha [Deltaproteobacteria bacterium]
MSGGSNFERGEWNLLLAGEAGQGLQVVEALLSEAFRQEGYCVFSGQEFMSRIRGGSNSTLLRIGSGPVRAWSDRTDLAIVFDGKALSRLEKRLQAETLILGDGLQKAGRGRILDVPLRRLAQEAGGALFVNSVGAGILWGIFGGRPEVLDNAVRASFSGKEAALVEKNLAAAGSGLEAGRKLKDSGRVSLALAGPAAVGEGLHLSGTEAIALGAMAGGCNFVFSYPMSPATGIVTFLARHGHDSGILVEQAEDEIGAANMVLGAWYAGARGMAATSGGGFALMSETISLSAMTETPMVVVLAQRPGPATGLPTRTEQGDLQLALGAGHGEFPRVLLAPGNPEQGFALARESFDLADSCQVPVILLADQYLLDSHFDLIAPLRTEAPPQAAIVETTAGYRRYLLTPSGISPRGVPGWGEGLIGVDSDEHDESGHITEDLELRIKMVDKRLRKFGSLAEKAIPAEWLGPEGASHLAVCWGSTLEIVREALACLGRQDLAALHFSQVFPLPEASRQQLERAKCPILVEGNATGQFGVLLTQHWGVRWRHRLLKYNGLPFSVEEVASGLRRILQGEGA